MPAPWDIPALRRLLEEILPQNTTFNDLKVTHEFEQLGRLTMMLNARRILSELGQTRLILLAIEDITGQQEPVTSGRPDGFRQGEEHHDRQE